jgi:DNA-binding response OmpR family regulator
VSPEPAALRVLIVDDDPDFARLVATLVTRAGYGAPAVCGTAAGALGRAPGTDLVLLDQQLPDGKGLDLLPVFQALPGRPAVILVTANGDEALAAQALRAGADDYLIKDQAIAGLLPEVIERARRQRALREALAAAERDLVHAERLAAIGQLAVTISHNVNNPLMAAFAEVGLLLADGELAPSQRASVAAIQQALERVRETLARVATLGHDQTTDYLDGIKMIDLSRRTAAAPVHAGHALLWIADEDLARVVASLLKHAGFAVERVDGAGELSDRAGRLGVSIVVVLGGDAPGVAPLGGFRPPRERGYTVVALVPGDGAAARAAGADHVVALPFDPGTFVPELLAAVGRLGE